MKLLLAVGLSLLQPLTACAASIPTWRGIHIWIASDKAAHQLMQTFPALHAEGVNQLVLEVNYSFEFQAHPELREKRFVLAATAHAMAAAARSNGLALIPEFNCLGHQSFGRRTCPLLAAHPEFNETPSRSPADPGVYCLSWCPRAPNVNKIIFSLIDEMAAAFEAKSFHVGMDEVYYIGDPECKRCHGADPARLFADQVNALHQHLVVEKRLQMLMWADRVIGPKYQGYSKYDNKQNDLSASIDLIPHDIVMCDWHYEYRTNYPSVPYLHDKGFPVWPAGFLPLRATQAFSDYCLAHRNDVIGYLATTWNETTLRGLPEWPPVKDVLLQWNEDTHR